jgi:hypothetical protein
MIPPSHTGGATVDAPLQGRSVVAATTVPWGALTISLIAVSLSLVAPPHRQKQSFEA